MLGAGRASIDHCTTRGVDDPDGAVRFAATGALKLLPDETLAEYREELLCMLDDSQSADFPDSYLSSILSAQPTNYAEAIVERLDLTKK